jgi:heterodisulfide reductase subunit A-like polyferredoxin
MSYDCSKGEEDKKDRKSNFLPHALHHPLLFIYQLIQWIISRAISPAPPPTNASLNRPRIAIIGAGLTGVSSASHCVGHGFDVTIFESGSREELGGIWSVSLVLSLKINFCFIDPLIDEIPTESE